MKLFQLVSLVSAIPVCLKSQAIKPVPQGFGKGRNGLSHEFSAWTRMSALPTLFFVNAKVKKLKIMARIFSLLAILVSILIGLQI